jgi:transposase InsO family protein
LCIEPGSPGESGYGEALNGKLQDECLKREILASLKEAGIAAEAFRRHYDTVRPHSSGDHRPPAPAAHGPGPFPLERARHMH